MTATTAELQLATLDALTSQTKRLSEWNSVDGARSWYVTSSATSVLILASNGNRRGAIVVNTDANTLWLLYGGSGQAPATVNSGGWTYQIPSGATWEMPQPVFTGPLYGIWTAAGAGVAETTEF